MPESDQTCTNSVSEGIAPDRTWPAWCPVSETYQIKVNV
jgi:hypothetical protein